MANITYRSITTVFHIALLWGLSGLSIAATTDLATTPLVTSTATVVRPNVLFTLDDSGSMGWDYLPDYAGGRWLGSGSPNVKHCKLSNSCGNGETPFQTNEYNGVAYNPRITYQPPVNADGTLKASQGSPWTAVKKDGFGVQSSSSINMTNGYPEVVYCDSAGSVCKKNGVDTDNPFSLRVSLSSDNPPAYAFPGQLTTSSPTTTYTASNIFYGTLNQPGTTVRTVYSGTLNTPTGGSTNIDLFGNNSSNPSMNYSGGNNGTVTVTFKSPTSGSNPFPAVNDVVTVTDNNKCSSAYRTTTAKITAVTGTTITYTANGGSGSNNSACAVTVAHSSPTVPAAAPSITYGSNVITVKLSSTHGLSTGSTISITGGNSCDSGYKANSVQATVVDAYTFTYPTPTSLGNATNSTCTITESVPTITKPGISRSGNVVTVSLSSNHGLTNGDLIQVANASGTCSSGYNTGGNSVVATVIDTKTFSYSGATGTNLSSTSCKIDKMVAVSGSSTVTTNYSSAQTKNSNPYYFVIVPTEYCDSLDLVNCKAASAPSASYIYPAPVRFCKDDATANLPPGNVGAQISGTTVNCQSKFSVGTGINFQYARYGMFYRVDVVPTRTTYGDEVINGNISVSGVNINYNQLKIIDRSGRSDCASAPDCSYSEEMTNFSNWYAYYQTRMQMMKSAAGRAFQPMDNRYRVGFNTINNVSSSYLPMGIFDATQKASWYSKFYAVNPGSSTPLREALVMAGRYFAGKKPTGMNDDPMEYSCQQNFTLLTTDGYWNGNDSSVKEMDGTTTMRNYDNVDSGLSKRSDGRYDGGLTGATNTLSDVAMYYYITDLRTATLGNCTGATGNTLCTSPDPAKTSPVTLDPLNNVPTNTKDTLATQHMVTYTLGLADGLMTYIPDYETATTGDFSKIKSGASGCRFSGSGICNWPLPAQNTQEALDDLWHAAVNGRGTYYNARDPLSLSRGLAGALAGINVRLAAAAASSTSSPNITQTDRSIFSTTYRTTKWDGEVQAQYIDPATGNVPVAVARHTIPAVSSISINATTGIVAVKSIGHGLVVSDLIEVKNLNAGTCGTAYATVTAKPVLSVIDANNFTYQGDTAGTTTTSCSIDNVPYVWSAQELLDSKVAGDATASVTSRTIYTFDSTVTPYLKPFLYANLTTAEQAYFDNKCASTLLSQCTPANLSPAQITSGNSGANLVDYLRGRRALEQFTSPDTVALFRPRDHLLGDTVNAKPAYVRSPQYAFSDNVSPTYSDFKSLQANRQAALYIASNDGMLHAFNADTGNEMWAYVPKIIMPNLYLLASYDVASNTAPHHYFVDGTPEVMDIYQASTTDPKMSQGWHTILVGGLNSGGRGFYALDVTNPAAPKGLWETCSDSVLCPGVKNNDLDIGYSFGNPVITKDSQTGKWVVLVTSGYNNVSPGTGRGYLFVLDAITGEILNKVDTGAGSATTPSGLAKIGAWSDSGNTNNTVRIVYGGDLNGDLWRFDLGAVGSTTTPSATKIASLQDGLGNAQSVTTRPVLADVLLNVNALTLSGNPVVYFGTGRYLGTSDLSDTKKQSLYALKDDLSLTGVSANLGSPRSRTDMVQKTLTQPTPTTRTISGGTVNWTVKKGWYVDFDPTGVDLGERVNIDPKLSLGTLTVTTNVPESSACTTGGYSWDNQFDYKNGSAVETSTDGVVSRKVANALTVGTVIVRLPSGQLKQIITDATGNKITRGVNVSGTSVVRRVSWRELFQ